jgi:hypothetical protein
VTAAFCSAGKAMPWPKARISIPGRKWPRLESAWIWLVQNSPIAPSRKANEVPALTPTFGISCIETAMPISRKIP